MAQVVIGLDVGTHAIRAARLKVGFRSMEIESLVSRRLDEDPWAVGEIRIWEVSLPPGL